jgi:hypothetical protein
VLVALSEVSFSIMSQAAWAPGVETNESWLAWAYHECAIEGVVEPPVKAMTPMLRRRAGFLGKMALEVAYRCLGTTPDVPTVFSSRHGEAVRSIDLLSDLAKHGPVSPTSFGLSVHNGTGGLFSIARGDRASASALAAGKSSVEHAVIEACGLLADGEPKVLLVVYDCPLPSLYSAFEDCDEQPFAWAWLMQPAGREFVSLSWSPASGDTLRSIEHLPAGLAVLRFLLRREVVLERICDGRRWLWARHG